MIDISAIDFAVLAKRFKKSESKNVELEQLKASIRAQLEKLIRLNKTRAAYLTKFEELIDSYNAGSRNIDDLFHDLLTRPGPDLNRDERDGMSAHGSRTIAGCPG